MDLSDFVEVAKIIRLPQDHVIAMFIAIGKATRAPWPRAGQLALEGTDSDGNALSRCQLAVRGVACA